MTEDSQDFSKEEKQTARPHDRRTFPPFSQFLFAILSTQYLSDFNFTLGLGLSFQNARASLFVRFPYSLFNLFVRYQTHTLRHIAQLLERGYVYDDLLSRNPFAFYFIEFSTPLFSLKFHIH
jgi:hypothetical protein